MPAAAIPLACLRNWSYLERMAQPASTHPHISAARLQGRVASMIVWSAAATGALAVLGAAALWFHYGTAVFFEMIAAGISACF
jgi:hypothetical protein